MVNHSYSIKVRWTGNTGLGTSSYSAYERSHEITSATKSVILGSSDSAFRGDADKYNPEELLLASLSSCHMLWYLHLCSARNITVNTYEDHASATMTENSDGSGKFCSATLNPYVQVREADSLCEAEKLHGKAHTYCFIANSINFPVYIKGKVVVTGCDITTLTCRKESK